MKKLTSEDILKYITGSKSFIEPLEEMTKLALIYIGIENIGIEDLKKSKSYSYLSNPKNYKRQSKCRLQNFHNNQFEIELADYGELDEVLLNKSLHDWINSNHNKKYLPMERVFTPDHKISDNYQIWVITTADDTQIICWTVTEG